MVNESYPGQVSGFFFYKTQTQPGPASGFFLKNPYPTLFFIESGKIRLIRVGPGRVFAGQI